MGGNKNTKFYLGLNHRHEGTVFPTDMAYKRTGGRLNVEHTDSDNKFHVNIGVVYTKDENNLITGVDAVSVATLAPNYPAYNPDGSLNWILPSNPYGWLKQKALTKTSNLNLNGVLRYSIVPGLNARVNLGYSEVGMDMLSTMPASSQWPLLQPMSSATFGANKAINQLVEPQIEYSNQFGLHNLKVLFGGTYQVNKQNGHSITGINYPNESLLQTLTYAGAIESKRTESAEYKYASFFSRVNYIAANRYLLSANYRRDGSTKFGPGKRYGDFWAVAGGWILSEEKFFAPVLRAISHAKIRASYGVTGNDQIPDYLYLATYASGQDYNNSVSLQPSLIANPDYSWETNKKLEIALELSLVQKRIDATIAWYRNRSGNQLVQYAIPFVSGFGSYQANLPAVIENKGLEVDVFSTNIKGKSFTWTSSFNLSIPRNKLVEYPDIEKSSYANTYIVGKDLSSIRRLQYLGVDPQTGLYKFEDQDRDGKLTFPNDYIVAGRTSPYYFGGLANMLIWRNWQLDVHFHYIKQFSLDNLSIGDAAPDIYLNKRDNVFDRWTTPGQTAAYQKPTASPFSDAGRLIPTLSMSDRQLINSSFIRLKNVSLSYRLPQRWLTKMKFTNVRLFIEGQNLWTYATTKGVDPETINGFASTVPVLKTFAGGINVSL
ncbi:SusC/RagA family TonB-linked outer membrane protein [Chitinophaga horti]|uniref:SusC/RagA family TonB-linked outer membrane protein n=1 Tax=Chitinophaga horti TaxID=2920382 RepID=A0ABY6JCF0_9BACT|nr:SusC/RagA family TonB-linked outer membrane protein [Chitinophaga horti]UYQ95966.1 SusC/RagA family TonB-linked outer membrane protein [Chitinophaga horti]